MTKMGYARVSTDDQNLDLQRDALIAAGCVRIHEDHGISGRIAARPGLDRALAALGRGDTLVVWRLDRLGRSLPHLLALAGDLEARGCGLASLTEAIDTGSAGGRLVFHIMGALAEFERALISERTRAGLQARRQRGQTLGRKPKLSRSDLAAVRADLERGQKVGGIASRLGVSRVTLWRALRQDAQAAFLL
ncbi:recombinase family protein [Sphingobium sp. AS12]|uniref:recombinase family protein n=1 Tax=Sphingobium sp. AS12 TaxID=2849495 RepID=UPI001C3158DC|nr:recombinase family protein [Sphingobium sp. AS12]MBV2147696.1 recombinase family protein [Sphingobium sp. AS12]